AEAGVYSTPQAVLLDAKSHIVFRGNYNVSRYCTDPRTEFVRIALEEQVGEGEARASMEVPSYRCARPPRSGHAQNESKKRALSRPGEHTCPTRPWRPTRAPRPSRTFSRTKRGSTP